MNLVLRPVLGRLKESLVKLAIVVEVFSQERVFVIDNWRKLEAFGVKGFSRKSGVMDKGQDRQFRMLVERSVNGGDPLIPIESIINTTRASFAAIQSLKQGTWVVVE